MAIAISLLLTMTIISPDLDLDLDLDLDVEHMLIICLLCQKGTMSNNVVNRLVMICINTIQAVENRRDDRAVSYCMISYLQNQCGQLLFTLS